MNDLFCITKKDVATRLEITEFSKDPALKVRYDLFLRAFAKLQSAPPTDIEGYYRLAAIHGWPLVTWPEGKESNSKRGYCVHGRPMFLPWHRVYMLLFEQHLLKIAIKLAEGAPEALRANYLAEAKQVRIPFWDWAISETLPAAALQTRVVVLTPETGNLTKTTSIINPLHFYKSTGIHHGDYLQQTHRDDSIAIAAAFKTDQIRATTSAALNNKTYGLFNNAHYPNASHSIEVPHDNVHDHSGGLDRIDHIGEMADSKVTAYDPIFWLHHSSIDRLYAMWQVINDTALWEENNSTDKTIDMHLAPFYNADKLQWTSRMIQKSRDGPTIDPYEYGVQYPETLKSLSPDARKDAVRKAMDRYAKPIGQGLLFPPGAVNLGDRLGLIDRPADLPVNAAIRREWEILIKYRSDLSPGNFTIAVFLGQPGNQTRGWRNETSFVGSVGTFKSSTEECDNCADQQGEYAHCAVFLTDKVYSILPRTVAGLEDFETLAKWLIEKLDWRISLAGGTEYPLTTANQGDISVQVVSYMKAYGPRDTDRNLIDCDLGRILGVTFDHKLHLDVKGGKVV